MSATSTSFDLARFCGAVEGRDADGQLEFYAPDATVTIADRITGPGSPRVLHGREEIRSWLEDIAGREMTHSVRHAVKDDGGAAFYEACRYPDGTNVICATVLELDGATITNQTVVQAWDES
jgi:SnoaL-like domain